MAGRRRITVDLLNDNPYKALLKFTIPVFIGNVFQQLYAMADTIIVGHTVSSDALAGVGCTGAISFLILGLAQGLTAGFGVKTSHYFGARDIRGLRKSIAVSLELCLLMTVLLTAAAVPLTAPLLRLMKTPEQYFDYAYWYMVVVFAGMGATILYNISANTLRAIGDSKTPLYLLIFAAVLNIVLDFVCIVPLNMHYTGAAVATVISQFVSGALSVAVMFIKYPAIRLKKEDWKWDGQMAKGHISLGLPMALQFSITAVGSIIQQTALNGLNASMPGVVTAYTAASKIDGIATQSFYSIGTAVATYTGQNYGAKQYGRIKDGVFVSMVYTLICWGVGMVFSIGLARPMTALFLDQSSGDAALYYGQMLVYAQKYLVYQSSFYLCLGIIFVYRNAAQAIGKSALAMFAGVTELAGRIFASVFLVRIWDFTGVCLSNPAAWICADIFLISLFYRSMHSLNGDRTCSLKTLLHPKKAPRSIPAQ